MKTRIDVETRLRNELNQWFLKQGRNIFDDYYLYHMPTTAEHDGGIIILKDRPKSPCYILTTGERIHKEWTVDQNFRHFYDVVMSLPILEMAAGTSC